MRHHIAIKFIAVLLAALSLFAAVGSGVCIFTLTAAGLYEESVDQLYEENTESTRRHFAVNLTHRYASLQLGNIPEDYLDQYYGSSWMYNDFQYGLYFYTIYDENGVIVEDTATDVPEEAVCYSIQVTSINYRTRVAVQPWQANGADDTIAVLEDPTTATEAPTETTEGTISTEPEATTPAISEKSLCGAIYFDKYYSGQTGETEEIAYTIVELPPYTVDLYLLPGAMPVEHYWSILRIVWNYRMELFYVLGIGLLAFAVCAVYLCCAAGKKPGRDEIRSGGLNCLPLDLYLAAGSFVIVLAAVFAGEGSVYLIRESPKVLAPFVAVLGYGVCLVFVGFCFACAAQFKTPGFYWWKNSLTGRCWQLLVKLWQLTVKLAVWLWSRIPDFCRRTLQGCKAVGLRLGQQSSKIALWLRVNIPRLCHWVLQTCSRLLLRLWQLIKKVWQFTQDICKRVFQYLGKKFMRFFNLLPLTWQWFAGGFLLMLMFSLVFLSNGEELVSFLCLCGCFALIGYGAHAFGILLESTRNMAKGDLNTQIPDQFLQGSFKDFSRELNALAQVAAVAAQKQLKSERMKTELITNVSHDIKTPLTSIINYVDLMQKPHTEEEQQMYLEVLSRQSNQLKKLIDDLMELSKASTGNMNADITSVNAVETVNQALGEFADKLERAQLIPVVHQPEEPVYMLADGRLAWRVIHNLLSNVVKYALPGTRVYVDVMELEGNVVISVKNISREPLNIHAEELLERFVRGDASRNTEGSGLGLNIAKSLMEVQHGQLQLLVDGDLFKATLVFPGANIL